MEGFLDEVQCDHETPQSAVVVQTEEKTTKAATGPTRSRAASTSSLSKEKDESKAKSATKTGKRSTQSSTNSSTKTTTKGKSPVVNKTIDTTQLVYEGRIAQGLAELQEIQKESIASIKAMTARFERFSHREQSHKRKRDELSESEDSDQQGDQQEQDGVEKVAGNPADVNKEVEELLSTTSKSSKPQQEEEDELLKELVKLYESEGTVTDPINAKLAPLIDKMVKTSLSEEQLKEKYDKYNRPENCENLTGTKVNPEIWSKIKSNTRSKDLKMQKLETTLIKSMLPMVQIADKLLELKSNAKSVSTKEVSDFLALSLDSLILMGHSINEVNLKRRDLIKPDLNDQFKQLCGSQTPITKLLFGDDLPKSVKEINETNRVGQKVSSKPVSGYSKYHKRDRPSSSHGRSFLYKQQGQWKKTAHQSYKKKDKSSQQN